MNPQVRVARQPRDRVWDVLCDLQMHSGDEIGRLVGPRWVSGLLELRRGGWPVRRAPDGAFFLESRSPMDMSKQLLAAEMKFLLDGIDRLKESRLPEPPPPAPEASPVASWPVGGGFPASGFVPPGSEEVSEDELESFVEEQEARPPEGHLILGSGLVLPPDAVTQTFAILAKKGSGKTFTAKVMCEEMIRGGYPVVIMDPTGAWWGLRAGVDGKTPGFPVVVLGGDHGDLPLHVTAGRQIAKLVVARKLRWLVLDMSLMMPDDQHRFAYDFCATLYHENRDALHVFVDEADEFASQKPADALEHKVLGILDRIVRRGRIRGLGITLITQRSAVLNKNVLSQAEVMVALRTAAPPDLDAIEAWTKRHVQKEERERFMSSLPKLPIGEAWFISPGWLGLFKRVKIRFLRTFDSSATPKVGEHRIVPEKLASVADLDEIREILAQAVPEVSSDDDKEAMVARIAELELKLRESQASRSKVGKSEITTIETSSRKIDESSKRMTKIAEDAVGLIATLEGLLPELQAASKMLSEKADVVVDLSGQKTRLEEDRAMLEEDDASPEPEDDDRKRKSNGDGANSTPVRILRAMAVMGRPLGSKEIGVLAGVRQSGAFYTRLSELRDEGFVVQNDEDGLYKLTVLGRGHLDKLGVVVPRKVDLSETLSFWRRGKVGLHGRQIEIVELVAKGGKPLTRVQIAELIGVVPTGGTFQEYMHELIDIGLFVGHEGRRLFLNPVLLSDPEAPS